MFRKIAFALVTTAALGAAALAPTAASARPFHHGHWGWGVGAGIVGTAIVADSCIRRQVFHTPYGWRTRWVNVCY
jgi:hypothetical protein